MKIYTGNRKLVKDNSFAVYADVETVLPFIDIHKESKKSGSMQVSATSASLDLGSEIGNIPLDFPQWLPFAAPKYHISPDVKDYVIVPVIAVPSDLPNRNRIAFPLKNLLAFNPEMGMQAFRTWVGKPTYREHVNDKIENAYGVIADTSMLKLRGWADGKIWKLLMLAAFDRSKYVEHVARIVAGEQNSYSMGAWVSGYSCSVCDGEVGKCGHIDLEDRRPQLTEEDGKLAIKNCEGITGFELSSVENPAWISAISDTVNSLE